MNERSFPPGIGGVAWAIALVVALAVSIWAAAPRFSTQTVASGGTSGYGGTFVGSGTPGSSVPGSTSTGGVAGGTTSSGTLGSVTGGSVGSSGSAGHYVAGSSGSYVGGSSGGYVGGSAGSAGTAGSGGTGGTGGSTGSGPTNVTNNPGTTGSGQGQVNCAQGQNGGATAPGVSASSITVAATTVTSGVGSGFLGQAEYGVKAALAEVNRAGGVCGRQIQFQTTNSGWDRQQGANDISGWIHSNGVFALVGQPDSEGLDASTISGAITAAQIPVVGTDGMLGSQYGNPWIWPVSAPTVTNMHIIAKYAHDKLGATNASDFGIVYDSYYKFGKEGADAFDAQVKRLTGGDIPGYGAGTGCTNANKQYCGFNGNNAPSSTNIAAFDSSCNPCKVVVMLLEPAPMEAWMNGESGKTGWYSNLFGGEPLFDDNLGDNCGGCAKMTVWTGYHAAVQPFDSEKPVANYVDSLHSVCHSCDAHNEFTEGAYIGAQLFIAGLQQVAAQNEPLTRVNLQAALNALTFDDGLVSQPLKYSSDLHLANSQMAAFSDNYSGSFNGWTYQNTGFVADPSPGDDMKTS